MHIEEIRAARLRQPFQPFVMQLTDGRSFPVYQPEFVAVGRQRVVVVIDPNTEGASFIEPLHVVSLEYTQAPSSSPPATGDRNGEPQ